MTEKDFKDSNDVIRELLSNGLIPSDLNDLIHDKKVKEGSNKDVANSGRSCFFTGLNIVYALRCSALVEIAEITNGYVDLYEDDVEKLLPYLAVVEKCCNIIDKATMEKIREDGG